MVRQTVIVGDVTTGRRLMAIPVSSGSWSVGAGADDSVDVAIPLASTDFQTLLPTSLAGITVWAPSGTGLRDILALTEPKRSFLAFMADDRVVAHGVVQRRSYSGSTMTLSATGIGGAILGSRVAIPATYPGRVQDASLDFTGLSLGTIIKRLVQSTLARPNGALPIVLPADAAGTGERHLDGFALGSLWQRVQELSQVEGGPEVALEPRLTADRQGVELVLRTGTTADPTLHQTGQDWTLDMSVPRGDLGGLTVTEDGSSVVNRAWASGSGTDTAVLLASAVDTTAAAAGYPLLEAVKTYASVEVQATLDTHAAADVAENARPWTTWTMRIPVDERLGQMRVGDWWSVNIGRGHPFLSSGKYRSRLASHSGKIGEGMLDMVLVPTRIAT